MRAISPYFLWLGILIWVTTLNGALTLYLHTKYDQSLQNGSLSQEAINSKRLFGWFASLLSILAVLQVSMSVFAGISLPTALKYRYKRLFVFLVVLLLISVIHGCLTLYGTERFYELVDTREIQASERGLEGSYAGAWFTFGLAAVVVGGIGAGWWLRRLRSPLPLFARSRRRGKR